MDAGKFISHHTIQEGLQKGLFFVKNNILENFGINNRNAISLKDLLHIICSDLKKMNFFIKESDNLFDYETGNSIPAIIALDTYTRKDGGKIKINKAYANSSKIEAIFHEYAHIKDDTLPILPTDKNAINWKALYSIPYLRYIEFQAKMIAFTLMMPPGKMWSDLVETAYDINSVLKIYKDFDKCSVLWWLAMNDSRRPYHFACVEYQKNYENEITKRIVKESFYYDHRRDPKPFDIVAVIDNKDSAANLVCKSKNREGEHKASIINGIEYYFYAYYESDFFKATITTRDPGINSMLYDRLLVIGWKKEDYDLIQMYKS